jgi:hypothetical protein
VQLRGQQSAQRSEDRAVDSGPGQAWVVSAEHGDLVSAQPGSRRPCCTGSSEQRQPAQYAGEQQIDESEGHSERACWAGCGQCPRGRLATKVLIRRRDRVLGTHRRCVGLNQVAGSPVFQNRTTNHREPRSTPQIRCVRSLGAGNTKGVPVIRERCHALGLLLHPPCAIRWRENGAVRLYLLAHVYPPLCNW